MSNRHIFVHPKRAAAYAAWAHHAVQLREQKLQAKHTIRILFTTIAVQNARPTHNCGTVHNEPLDKKSGIDAAIVDSPLLDVQVPILLQIRIEAVVLEDLLLSTSPGLRRQVPLWRYGPC